MKAFDPNYKLQEMPENLRKTLPDIDKLQDLLSENDSQSETVR